MLNIFQLILRGLIIIALLNLAIAKDFNSVKATEKKPTDLKNFSQKLNFLNRDLNRDLQNINDFVSPEAETLLNHDKSQNLVGSSQDTLKTLSLTESRKGLEFTKALVTLDSQVPLDLEKSKHFVDNFQKASEILKLRESRHNNEKALITLQPRISLNLENAINFVIKTHKTSETLKESIWKDYKPNGNLYMDEYSRPNAGYSEAGKAFKSLINKLQNSDYSKEISKENTKAPKLVANSNKTSETFKESIWKGYRDEYSKLNSGYNEADKAFKSLINKLQNSESSKEISKDNTKALVFPQSQEPLNFENNPKLVANSHKTWETLTESILKSDEPNRNFYIDKYSQLNTEYNRVFKAFKSLRNKPENSDYFKEKSDFETFQDQGNFKGDIENSRFVSKNMKYITFKSFNSRELGNFPEVSGTYHIMEHIPLKLRNSKGHLGNFETSKLNMKYLEHSEVPRQYRNYLKASQSRAIRNCEVFKEMNHIPINLRNSKGNLGSSEGKKLDLKYLKHLGVPQKHRDSFTASQSRELRNLKVLNRKFVKSFNVLKILQEALTLKQLNLIKSYEIINTSIIFDFQGPEFKFPEIFSFKHPPIVIISADKPWELRANFNSNFLSLVFLEKDYLRHLKIVKISLNRRHLKKIILITQTLIPSEQYQINEAHLKLFNWLHENGFWNSLLMDMEGNTLAFEDLTGKIIKNLTLKEFLSKEIKWPDLKGYPITCFIGSNPPRAFVHRDHENNIQIKGYYGTVLKLFAKYYNASLKPYILPNLDYYSELDCGKYIAEGKVDICGDASTYNPLYVITMPEEIAPSYLMVPYDKPLPRFYYFLKPFHLDVWTIVTCSFFYKVITLSFIHRLQHGTWNASLQILYGVLSVMFLPFQLHRVKGKYRKFLELIMILVGFVVANWYLSVLSSLLFTRLYSHDIRTLEDLKRHNLSIMVNEFEQYLLNSTENDPIIMQQLKVVSNDILLKHRRNLDPHYAYYSQYDKIEFYLHQQKFLIRPRLKILTGIPPINEVLAGIPMSPNWPFQHLLNDFLHSIAESGVYLHILENAMEEGISTGYLHYFPTEYHYVEPLSIEYFQMPAMLLAAGYTLGLLGFLMEIMVAKKCKRN